MYVLVYKDKVFGEPMPLKEFSKKYSLVRHSLIGIKYKKCSTELSTDIKDSARTTTHWKVTPEGYENFKKEMDDNCSLSIGRPIDKIGANHCPEEWIIEGWVTEATPKEHKKYLSELHSIWDIGYGICK